MSFPVFPPEIIAHVLSFYPLPEPAFVDPNTRSDSDSFTNLRSKELLQLSLVSPLFRTWAQKELFSSPLFEDLESTQKFTSCMEDLGERGAELKRLVRRVRVGRLEVVAVFAKKRAGVGIILSQCCNVEELWLSNASTDWGELNHGKNLLGLYFNQAYLQCGGSGNVTLSLPKLEHMSFGFQLTIQAPSIAKVLANCLLPSLRFLSYRPILHTNMNQRSIFRTSIPLSNFPALNSLSLEDVDLLDQSIQYAYTSEHLLLLDISLLQPLVDVQMNISRLPPKLQVLRVTLKHNRLLSNPRRRENPVALSTWASGYATQLRVVLRSDLTAMLEELIIGPALYELCPQEWQAIEGDAAKRLTVEAVPEPPPRISFQGNRKFEALVERINWKKALAE